MPLAQSQMDPSPPLQPTPPHPRAAPTLTPPLQNIPPDHILYASQCEDIRRVCAPGGTAADFSRSQGGMPQFGAGKYSERTAAEVDLCMESCGLLSATSLRTPRSYKSAVRPPAPRAIPVKFEAFQDPARFPLPFDPYYEIHLPFTREGSAARRETSGDEEQGRAFHLRANQAGGHVPFLICSTAEGKKRASKNGLIYRACFLSSLLIGTANSQGLFANQARKVSLFLRVFIITAGAEIRGKRRVGRRRGRRLGKRKREQRRERKKGKKSSSSKRKNRTAGLFNPSLFFITLTPPSREAPHAHSSAKLPQYRNNRRYCCRCCRSSSSSGSSSGGCCDIEAI